MEKLDRLGWAAGLSFRSYGLRIGLRTNLATVPEEWAECLPPGWKAVSSPVVDRLYSLRVGGSGGRGGLRQLHLLYTGVARLARTEDLGEALRALESDLEHYVAERSRRRIFVHAGVVGWRGRALLLPGGRGAGKSRLVAALVRAGATYYSDEYAVLDHRGRVYPFTRPLALREGPDGLPRRCSAGSLGGSVGVKPFPVGLVAISDYRDGSRWRPRVLSPGHALLALLEHTVPARHRPVASLEALRQVVAQAAVVKGPRGEAEDMVEALLGAASGAGVTDGSQLDGSAGRLRDSARG